MSRWFDLEGWAFVPGPADTTAPMNSLDLQEIACHPPANVAAVFLSFPGMGLIHGAEPDWWHWKAHWGRDGDERFLDIDMTLMGEDEECWGGSSITAHCTVGDVLDIFTYLQARLSGIWLHTPDCIMHTPDSFRRMNGIEVT